MSQFPFQIVGFDLDGTLVDSNRDLAPAINHALHLAGRPEISPEATRKLIGGGARRMLERALELTGGMPAGAEIELLYGALLKHYEAHIADHTVPYPGCVEALDALLDRGCRLAVITNKIEAFSRKLLDALDLTDRFELILGGDTLGPGRAKPAPDMIDNAMLLLGDKQRGGRFAMVGDSSYDVRAAKNAEVPVVALSFGYNDLPAEELGADAVIDHYDELVGVLEELGGSARV
jgi:phosphoglycolate phosphatase